jgi:SAM-dependent methyltransferase
LVEDQIAEDDRVMTAPGARRRPPHDAMTDERRVSLPRLDPSSIRRSDDSVASRYADEFVEELAYKPLDRALLTVLAADVRRAGHGPIADLGGGPGHVASFLAGAGADVLALDLAPNMATIAHHRLRLNAVAASLASLPLGCADLGGATAFYCLIHLDDDGLDAAAQELARVVALGGPVLAAFHAGEEVRHLDEWWDHAVDLDFRFLDACQVTDRLDHAGFTTEAVLVRASYPEETDTRRTYVLARRNAA